MSDSSISSRFGGTELRHVEPPTGPQLTPSGQVPSVELRTPQTETAKDQAVMVSFDQTQVETNSVMLPSFDAVTDKTKVQQFLAENAARKPQSVSRIGEFYVIQVDAKTSIKTTGHLLEQALRDRKLPSNSGLAKALLMTELMTNSALPPRAQRAIQAMVSSDRKSYLAAQESAVLAAFVEGAANPETFVAIEKRIQAIPPQQQGLKDELMQALYQFRDAVTDATHETSPTRGQYQKAYDALNTLEQLARPITGGQPLYVPDTTSVAPSNLIGVINGRQGTGPRTLSEVPSHETTPLSPVITPEAPSPTSELGIVWQPEWDTIPLDKLLGHIGQSRSENLEALLDQGALTPEQFRQECVDPKNSHGIGVPGLPISTRLMPPAVGGAIDAIIANRKLTKALARIGVGQLVAYVRDLRQAVQDETQRAGGKLSPERLAQGIEHASRIVRDRAGLPEDFPLSPEALPPELLALAEHGATGSSSWKPEWNAIPIGNMIGHFASMERSLKPMVAQLDAGRLSQQDFERMMAHESQSPANLAPGFPVLMQDLPPHLRGAVEDAVRLKVLHDPPTGHADSMMPDFAPITSVSVDTTIAFFQDVKKAQDEVSHLASSGKPKPMDLQREMDMRLDDAKRKFGLRDFPDQLSDLPKHLRSVVEQAVPGLKESAAVAKWDAPLVEPKASEPKGLQGRPLLPVAWKPEWNAVPIEDLVEHFDAGQRFMEQQAERLKLGHITPQQYEESSLEPRQWGPHVPPGLPQSPQNLPPELRGVVEDALAARQHMKALGSWTVKQAATYLTDLRTDMDTMRTRWQQQGLPPEQVEVRLADLTKSHRQRAGLSEGDSFGETGLPSGLVRFLEDKQGGLVDSAWEPSFDDVRLKDMVTFISGRNQEFQILRQGLDRGVTKPEQLDRALYDATHELPFEARQSKWQREKSDLQTQLQSLEQQMTANRTESHTLSDEAMGIQDRIKDAERSGDDRTASELRSAHDANRKANSANLDQFVALRDQTDKVKRTLSTGEPHRSPTDSPAYRFPVRSQDLPKGLGDFVDEVSRQHAFIPLLEGPKGPKTSLEQIAKVCSAIKVAQSEVQELARQRGLTPQQMQWEMDDRVGVALRDARLPSGFADSIGDLPKSVQAYVESQIGGPVPSTGVTNW